VLPMSEGRLSPAASAVNQHLLIVSCFVSLYKGCVSLSIDKHVSCVPLRVPPRGVLSCRQPTSTCHGTPTAQTHLSNQSHASHLRPTRSCVTRPKTDSLYINLMNPKILNICHTTHDPGGSTRVCNTLSLRQYPEAPVWASGSLENQPPQSCSAC
jgi:hypothetical protein